MTGDGMDIQQPSDVLNKLSQALIQISNGDPIVALRSEMKTKFESVDTLIQRIDKATDLQHQDMVRVPTLLTTAIDGQRALIDQQLARLAAEMSGDRQRLVDKLREEVAYSISEMREKFVGVASQFNQNDKALTAALQAQEKQAIATTDNTKEAIKEMKDGFTKLMDSVVLTMNTKTQNLETSVNDLKGIVISLQSRAGTTVDNRRDSRDDQRNILSVVSVVISMAALATIIVIELIKH
jgi:hypothetical protein